ncbi:MAG: HNH endonuclease [Acidobacteriaceae bacterium]|nr:HNH endonuclease [Acidobacteriaceae bacterium]
MWRISAPVIPVQSVLDACVVNVADAGRKAAFEALGTPLSDAAEAFWTALQSTTLHELPEVDTVGGMTTADMIWLYEQKLVPAKAPGRAIYDTLKMAAPNGKCPLCGRGTVYSLDHHLPKTRYADLTITPTNLIPSCQDCNKTKTQSIPLLAAEETIHPYIDDIDVDIWLRARVVEVTPAALFFYADPPPSWPLTLQRRVKHHFRVFKLRKAYASEAGYLIGNIRGHLIRNVSKQGATGIRAYLADQAESCRDVRRNSWEAAAYSALSESDWFCNGGYSLLG